MSTSKTNIQDRELMRFFDGELDDERAEEIERWLEEGELDDEVLDRLAGLELVGDLVAEMVDGDDRAEGVADAVMAQLEAAADDTEATEEGGELVPLKKPDTPANDNAPRIYLLAAVAAAAAAGLFIWGNEGQDTEPPPHAYVPPATVTAAPTERPMTPEPSSTAVVAAEEEDGGVEIAAVDFGTHRGSVFYVGDASAGRTAVVWINDAGEP